MEKKQIAYALRNIGSTAFEVACRLFDEESDEIIKDTIEHYLNQIKDQLAIIQREINKA